MTDDFLFGRGTTHVRRLRLAPGEATPWHRDPFHRVAVIVSGDAITIEFREDQSQRIEVSPGLAEWDEPSKRVHRAVNTGEQPYEQITVFFLDNPDAVPQPVAE